MGDPVSQKQSENRTLLTPCTGQALKDITPWERFHSQCQEVCLAILEEPFRYTCLAQGYKGLISEASELPRTTLLLCIPKIQLRFLTQTLKKEDKKFHLQEDGIGVDSLLFCGSVLLSKKSSQMSPSRKPLPRSVIYLDGIGQRNDWLPSFNSVHQTRKDYKLVKQPYPVGDVTIALKTGHCQVILYCWGHMGSLW